MPIFQDPDRQRLYDLWPDGQQTSQDQTRHTCCWVDYHEVNGRFASSERGDKFPQQRASMDHDLSKFNAHDRQELIHYIKAADTSKWSQPYSVGDESAGHSCKPRTPEKSSGMKEHFSERNSSRNGFRSSEQELASPFEIERPRSALHSGDFREGAPELRNQQQSPQSPFPRPRDDSHFPLLGSSPTTPWFTPPAFPLRTQTSPAQLLEEKVAEANRSRAPSLGSFSSYVLKTPTSPLVHQANNTDLDFTPRAETFAHPNPLERTNRRRTLPPETFRNLQALSSNPHGTAHSQAEKWRDPLSYQPSAPRRSLTSAYSLQLASSFQGPSQRARRPTLVSEASSRPHAPMVGSYEESILRGRMSMNPSKPLDFTAQIGVLGRGKCKASLKCPPHVTIPFPAVFYSYPTSGNGRSISDDSPSPYVGLIDLDHSLPRDTSNSSRRRKRHQSPADLCTENPLNALYPRSTDHLRRREKRHRRAESPRSPSGGCYRIPQQGQLQVMIKNPNKTAVKLFLVPYDLSDMEAGTKTFIRQRSYSAGPTIDMPLTARTNYGTDRPEASLNPSDDPTDKPILRYLIHLNICCPSRGRFYLHSSVRVVFANRVPDGKEKLRNEIQHPEPRYSPYKPTREPSSLNSSTKFPGTKGLPRLDTSGDSTQAYFLTRPDWSAKLSASGSFSQVAQGRLIVSPIPLNDMRTTPGRSENLSPLERPAHPFQPIPSIRDDMLRTSNSEPAKTQSNENEPYSKLSRDDPGYGGYQFGINGVPEAGESLLAKRLRGLDVQNQGASSIR